MDEDCSKGVQVVAWAGFRCGGGDSSIFDLFGSEECSTFSSTESMGTTFTPL